MSDEYVWRAQDQLLPGVAFRILSCGSCVHRLACVRSGEANHAAPICDQYERGHGYDKRLRPTQAELALFSLCFDRDAWA